MFDGLLKSKFYCKCKSDLKMTKTRIDLIRKKRNAMQKYLRTDVADLLRSGLDTNAYGRAEGLLVEMNRSSCYEFVEQCCEHISNNLPAMDKQSECPEECRESASSLMFAAARFADLPELREIRTIFSERYGKSLDCFINKEFSEKLKSDVVSKDMKLQLLQEIAAESGLDWDSKTLENKLFNEPAYNKNFAKVEDSDRKKDHRGTANELKEANTRYEDRSPKKKETAEPKRPEAVAVRLPVKDIPMDTILKPIVGKNEDKPLNYKSNPPPYTVDDSSPVPVSKPAPKSVRRRSSSKLETDFEEKKTNREKAAQGQRILRFFDEDGGTRQPDDDEKMMDKLLHYYSRKKGSSSDEKGKAAKYRTTNRVSSLPIVDLDGVAEGSKKQHHNRSSSLQEGMLRGGHVHPKLPDYEDFVSRLEALRGNSKG